MFAQAEDPGQWVDDLYMVGIIPKGAGNTFVFIDEKGVIQKKIPSLSLDADFPTNGKHRSRLDRAHWFNDALYAFDYGSVEAKEDGSLFKRRAFAKWQEGKWHFLGNFETDEMELLDVIPCEGGRFIVVSCRQDLTGNKGPDRTPFARASFPGGKTDLRIGAPIGHGQDELQKYMQDEEIFALAWSSKIIMTPKHATLVNPSTGLFWCFSLEKASLVKAGNIFRKVTPEMVTKGGFPMSILCVNPEIDGTVLIAAQDENFFVTETGDAYKEINDMMENNPSMSEEEAHKILARRLEELARRNPYIVWYRLHPENGRVEKLGSPPEGAPIVRDGGKNDHWRPMPDRSVKVIYWLERDLKQTWEAEAKKAEEKKAAEKKAEEEAKKKQAQFGTQPPKAAATKAGGN
jgi:hypothetical protein